MTIREGRKQGIKRFRVRSDIETDAYLKFDGGPWVRLYCRKEQEVTELPTLQEVIFTVINMDSETEEYEVPLDRADSELN